jgi:predicted secreted protein
LNVKFANQVRKWSDAGQAVWSVDVCEAGDYRLELTYKGEGRLAWRIETDEGVRLRRDIRGLGTARQRQTGGASRK